MTDRNPQNILVTGGAGFIGSAFIRFLLQKEKEWKGPVINLDALTYAGNLDNLTSIADDPRYLFIHGDITNGPLVEHLCLEHEIDTIVHFAAESHVDRSIQGPKTFIETNILGTFHLLEVIRRFPHIHFHHVSTDEVYGTLGKTGLFTESTPYQPSSPYSASKAASDHLVRAYGHTYALSTSLSNCSNNFGPYQFPEKLIPLMLLRAAKGESLPIYGNGENIRDWLYVDDHAEALWLLLRKGKKGETYNIGGGNERSNIAIVREILRLLAPKIHTSAASLEKLITFVTDRPGHDFRYAIDGSKIETELGWRPKHSFTEALATTIDWYLSHPEWISRVTSGEYQEWVSEHYIPSP